MSKFSARLKQLRTEKDLSQQELADQISFFFEGSKKCSKSSINMYERGEREPGFEMTEAFADFFNVDMDYLLGKSEHRSKFAWLASLRQSKDKENRIKVYGSVPAGIPIEAVEDVVDWEDIPLEWLKGGQKYIGLRVIGDSMYPKYVEGDTIIVRLQPDCESGQDAVVYVNGYDATLKKVLKNDAGIMLQPLNPNYEPKQYDYNDERYPVSILGVVVEIRRKV